MKVLISLAVLVAVVAATDFYTEEYHKVDFRAVVADDEQLHSWLKCFLSTGPCVGIQNNFKQDLPEAVTTACARCTDIQKGALKVFLHGAQQKFPEEVGTIVKSVDPEGKYFPALNAALANY